MYYHPTVEAYAQSLLERHASEPPDENLGAYVTAFLRSRETALLNCCNNDDKNDEDETAAMIELLTEHAHMSASRAQAVLHEIAHVVRSGVVPDLELSLTEEAAVTESSFAGSIQPEIFLPSVLSPLHEDNLIPGDLLGYIDDETQQQNFSAATFAASTPKKCNTMAVDFLQSNDDPFPPLGPPLPRTFESIGASGFNASAISKKGRKKGKSISANASSSQPLDATDLAAALFRPSRRPRPNSFDESLSASTSTASTYHETEVNAIVDINSHSNGHGLLHTHPEAPMTVTPYASNTTLFAPYNSDDLQLQFENTLEILLTMNTTLSEQAAADAALLADCDINVAQFLVDTAVEAPPVCRHLLQGGCYRSDCQFSHDIDTHTCLFWMRGRCGKGDQCRFLHGFHSSTLQQIANAGATNSTLNAAPVLNDQRLTALVYPDMNDAVAFDEHRFHGSDNNYIFDGATPAWGDAPAHYLYQAQQQRPHQQQQISPSTSSFSFANVAYQNYDMSSSFVNHNASLPAPSFSLTKTVKIPQDLWTPHDNRDASAFQISNPMERYYYVMARAKCRNDVIDLHFQSTKTFPIVLATVLPEKLQHDGLEQIWIVTGTGHHVGTQTHQKSGGALENAVVAWLTEQKYTHARGRDRNGQGGAVLVER